MHRKFTQIERRMAEKGFFKFLFLRTRQKLDGIVAAITRKIISLKTPVQKNKVVFMHFNNSYSCNPSYICDEILRQGLPWELVYVSDKKRMNKLPRQYPEGVKIVRRNSLEHFYEMASAKIWVDNAVCFPWEYLPKKKDQIYINTWHGSMGLKRIDANKIKSSKWAKAAKKVNKITDFMISNSKFETEVYRSTYWPNPKIQVLEYGHPRNDILFSDEEQRHEIKKKICDFYEVDEDTKFILYAPTFRDDKGNLDCYNIDYNRIIAAAEKRFGGKWKVINRFHFKVAAALKKMPLIRDNPDILNGNDFNDIQQLMLVSDMGITDYSSWICDFVLTGKPGFIYATDLNDYNDERGFYYPLESTPFAIATNNDEMENNILTFDENIYNKKKEQFLSDRGCAEHGNAAYKVVELMKKYINE
ncbi:MAG: CDP-glycerol glycerophosphotransferase family protein [Oscillospiraceae bacterium]